MRVAQLVKLSVVAGVGLAAWWARAWLILAVPSPMIPVTPHLQYEVALRLAGMYPDWEPAGERVLAHPGERPAAFEEHVSASGADGSPYAWRLSITRGRRVRVRVGGTAVVFIDLFRSGNRSPVASAPATEPRLEYVARGAEELTVRVQWVPGEPDEQVVSQDTGPSLDFPLPPTQGRRVSSGFGASRERGRRRHEGIDLFAPRGTPVLAAGDGWVGPQTSNGLGGNVVWQWVPTLGVSLYYAHLDRHAVRPGQRVSTGDIIGYVGNTGNARGTAPHLHFGIYATDGAVDPAPFVVP